MKSLFWNTLYPFVRGVFLSLFLFINTIFAQPWKRPEVASQWYFGKGAGLDFRSGVPVAVSGSICAWEGTTTFSDSVGNLLALK